jgi:hypothetical protein
LSTSFYVCDGLGVWTQDLALYKQTLYHLNPHHALFTLVIFLNRVLVFCLFVCFFA